VTDWYDDDDSADDNDCSDIGLCIRHRLGSNLQFTTIKTRHDMITAGWEASMYFVQIRLKLCKSRIGG
jgi:hypothetical protein